LIRSDLTTKSHFLDVTGGIIKAFGIFVTAVSAVLLYAPCVTSAEFKISGKVWVDIQSDRPQLNYPRGQSAIPFTVQSNSNAWHMQFQMPASYAGKDQQVDYYGTVGGERYSVIVERDDSGPGGISCKAGISEGLDPVIAYKSSAVVFLVWYTYLAHQESLETVPALFYDHRANSVPSNGNCIVSIENISDQHVMRASFIESTTSMHTKKSSALYTVSRMTNINNQVFVRAFNLEAVIRIPMVVGDKLLFEDHWVNANESSLSRVNEKLVVGSQLRAELDRIEVGPQTVPIPPPLKENCFIVDSRFGKDYANLAFYTTNRWLEKSEARPIYELRHAALLGQPVEFADNNLRPASRRKVVGAIIAFISLSAIGFFLWLAYSAIKTRASENTRKH
jgi:hypothetical protein